MVSWEFKMIGGFVRVEFWTRLRTIEGGKSLVHFEHVGPHTRVFRFSPSIWRIF